jgi:uncharacterized protein YqhQ
VLGATAATLAISSLVRRRRPATAAREGLIQAIGVIPAVVALSDRDLAAYHGAEHKAIAAYEQGADDARDTSKEHERCGSHLVAPLLASNLAGTLLLRQTLEKPGPLAGAAVALASTAVAVELFGWCERNSETKLAQALRRPGFEIQRLIGTREPDERQLEVGRAALAEILRVEAAYN